MKQNFLIEIETEELPPKDLKNTAISFKKQIIKYTKIYNLLYKKINWFATPRRIAILLKNIHIDIKKKIYITHKGPLITHAFDKFGQPTSITNHWMKKLNITIDQTQNIKSKNHEWITYIQEIKHANIEKILNEICLLSIKNIPISNPMKWNSKNIQFSRPIRNIIMLLNDKVIKSKILGLKTNRLLSGHTFMTEKKIILSHANEYSLTLLTSGKIIADYNIRKNKIKEETTIIAKSINGILKINETLLEEITSLVEWPTILIGTFNIKFLNLPNEILASILEKKQKCFPIYNKNKKNLLNFFIIVSNIETHTPKNIILGYEQIINTQFSDVKYFFKKDTQIKLTDYIPLLKQVIFYDDLGNMFEKTNRIKKLVTWISKYTNANLEYCIQAAKLSKCDLVTNMAFEFPEYSGIIGMYYALYHSIPKEISIAIKEQYNPRFSKDILPSHPVSYSLALADKIDTLVGIFHIYHNDYDKISEKDPFALRRLAIGILRIITKKNLNINLYKLLNQSFEIYNILSNDLIKKNLIQKIIPFILNKIFTIYEKRTYDHSIIKSILMNNPEKLIYINYKIKAMSYILKNHPDTIISIIHTNKRINNILKNTHTTLFQDIKPELLQQYEENQLIEKLKFLTQKNNLLDSKEKYIFMLFQLQKLCVHINNFFNNVKINHENIDIKINRLTLLKKIKNLFLIISNFSDLNLKLSK